MQQRRIRSVAVDLEFIKCRGTIFARSVAFVPFSATSRPLNSSTSSQGDAHHGGPSVAVFSEPATVLALSPAAVMREAEVLPCGHALASFMQCTLLAGVPLKAIKTKYADEAEAALGTFRDMRKALRESAKAQKEEKKAITVGSVGSSITTTDASSHTTIHRSENVKMKGAATEEGKALQRYLQIRAGISRHFESLDPFGLPNIARFDRSSFEALYNEAVDSHGFEQASKHLSCLRAYGRGRGRLKALAFLIRYYPDFIQEILRSSFADARTFLAWLDDCALHCEACLRECNDTHRALQENLLRLPTGKQTFATAREHELSLSELNKEVNNTVYFRECDSLGELSRAMSSTWASFLDLPTPTTVISAPVRQGHEDKHLHEARGSPHRTRHQKRSSSTKFFVYGTQDSSVIHATLQLCFSGQAARQMFGSRATAAGRFIHRKTLCKDDVSEAKENGMNIRREEPRMLTSPYDAQVIDITSHSLFSASGFVSSDRKTPALLDALKRLKGNDDAATALLDVARAHDPLWDARALACICVRCGVVR